MFYSRHHQRLWYLAPIHVMLLDFNLRAKPTLKGLLRSISLINIASDSKFIVYRSGSMHLYLAIFTVH